MDDLVDDESQELLAKRRVETGFLGEGPEPGDLNSFAIGVSWGEPHLGLVFADALGDLEPLSEQMNERSIDVVDARTAVFENRIVIHDGMVHTSGREGAIGLRSMSETEGPTPAKIVTCLLYTSPSPRDQRGSRMPSSA